VKEKKKNLKKKKRIVMTPEGYGCIDAEPKKGKIKRADKGKRSLSDQKVNHDCNRV